jgi:hypothetical protein
VSLKAILGADVALGGSARSWQATADNFAVAAGMMVRGATLGNGFAGWPLGVLDAEVSAKITAIPTGGGSVYLDLHRQAPDGSPDGYRTGINSTGAATMLRRTGGTHTILASFGTATVGDRYALRYYRGVVEARRNGVLVASVADATITTPGLAGVAAGATNTSLGVDAFALDALT